jgi:hypothetical protein
MLTETLGLLPEARQFVTEGERLVSKQRAVVQSLERGGYDTLDAVLSFSTSITWRSWSGRF